MEVGCYDTHTSECTLLFLALSPRELLQRLKYSIYF